MGRIFEGMQRFLKEHFDADKLEPLDDQMLEDQTLAFKLEDEDGREWGCLAVAVEEADQAIFYSVVLETTPEDQRNEVMRFVTLANYGMQVGNFEIDLDDGEVRFKTAIDVEDADLQDALLRNLVDVNLMMMGLYFDGLMAVIEGKTSAADAIAEIEEDEDDDDDE